MGQRLNIELIMNGQVAANAYYHWSAYTSSSLQLTQMVLEKEATIDHENPIIRAIRLLEVTGARVTEEEMKAVKELASGKKFDLAKTRNDGLISITEKGKNETRHWEEGRVDIDFDKKTVNFSVFWSDSKENYLEEYEKEEADYQHMPTRSYDFSAIPFEAFNAFAEDLWALMEQGHYAIRLADGDVCGFIE